MHKSIGSIFVAIAVLLPAGAGRAADDAICNAYVKEAVVKAEGGRQFKCGFDLDDPRWSADHDGHAHWCKDASTEEVVREQVQRRGEIKLCQTCRIYANLAIAAAADNIKFNCGFDGPRWNNKAEDHFGWCLQQRETIGAETRSVGSARNVALEKTEGTPSPIKLETGARVREAVTCKARQPNARKIEPKR
jgi:hypothetical protein